MRAARVHYFADFDGVVVEDIEQPVPESGEVLVRVEATSLHPSDIRNFQGVETGVTLPRTPGRDFAGVVEEGPQELIGLEVWGSGSDLGTTRDGPHAQYLVLPKGAISLKPDNLSFAQAASVGVNYITAYIGLVERAKIQPSEFIVVNGVNGGIGAAAMQIGHWLGAQVITMDDPPLSAELQDRMVLKGAFSNDIGMDHVETLVKEITGGGPHVTFDGVGGFQFERCLSLLRPGGRHIAVASLGEARVSFDLRAFYRNRKTILGVASPALNCVESASILETLRPAFESGKLHIGEHLTIKNLSDVPALYSNWTIAARERVILAPQHPN